MRDYEPKPKDPAQRYYSEIKIFLGVLPEEFIYQDLTN
jgi:hypothetical protein